MTAISYNITNPSGRAIAHLLDQTVLHRQFVQGGLTLAVFHGGGRTLSVHKAFEEVLSDGESGLLLLIESLAGVGTVNMSVLFDSIDADHALIVAQAVWLAAGYDIAAVKAS